MLPGGVYSIKPDKETMNRQPTDVSARKEISNCRYKLFRRYSIVRSFDYLYCNLPSDNIKPTSVETRYHF